MCVVCRMSHGVHFPIIAHQIGKSQAGRNCRHFHDEVPWTGPIPPIPLSSDIKRRVQLQQNPLIISQ